MFIASQMPFFRGVFRDSSEPLGVVLGATIIVGIQFIDDLRDLSPPAKLAGVVLGASVMYFFGLSMFYFRIPFAGFVVLAPDVAPLMTVLWVAGMTQAINLIDGLDGLAAGIVAIAAAAFTIYSQRLSDGGLLAPENIGPLLAVIACGICLGYLPHNVHPAKVFMADSGAYLLGVLMASSTLVVGGRIADQFSGQTYFFYAPIFIPLFILGVPILDVATPSTSITVSSEWATASAAPCSSCGRGRRCCRDSSSRPPSAPATAPSSTGPSRSRWQPSGSPFSRSSTPASGTGRRVTTPLPSGRKTRPPSSFAPRNCERSRDCEFFQFLAGKTCAP
jgi:hypothetical protein